MTDPREMASDSFAPPPQEDDALPRGLSQLILSQSSTPSLSQIGSNMSQNESWFSQNTLDVITRDLLEPKLEIDAVVQNHGNIDAPNYEIQPQLTAASAPMAPAGLQLMGMPTYGNINVMYHSIPNYTSLQCVTYDASMVYQQQVNQPGDMQMMARPSPPTSAVARPVDSPSPDIEGAMAQVKSYTGNVPTCAPFPGLFGFEISVAKQPGKMKKSVPYLYDEEKKKLYVKHLSWCPIEMKCGSNPPPGTVIRAVLVYSTPQFAGDVVERCQNHASKDSTALRQHFIQAHPQDGSRYVQDPQTGRYSVILPWDTPAAGTNINTVLYRFTCFSSCAGTNSQHRQMRVIFTLENNNVTLARQSLEIRSCASPGRDKMAEELGYNEMKRNNPAQQLSSSTKKRRPNQADTGSTDHQYLAEHEDKSCTLTIRGAKKTMQALAKFCKTMDTIEAVNLDDASDDEEY